MNELKPVAWHTEDHTDDFSATTYDKELAERWEKKGWPLTPMYYAIPDTHRVVSVALLARLIEETPRYATEKELQFIIDNKGPT